MSFFSTFKKRLKIRTYWEFLKHIFIKPLYFNEANPTYIEINITIPMLKELQAIYYEVLITYYISI